MENTAPSLNKIKITAVGILVALLFAPVIMELVNTWRTSDDYSHGFFVIPISLFMVWQKREKLRNSGSKPSWLGLPVFTAGSIIYLISFITRFHTLQYLSMPMIIIGLLLFLAGLRSTRELIFPVLFLLFMFPIPSNVYILLTNPLKLVVTKISAEIVYLIGVPVYREGNILYMASTQLEVAEACSGIRSLYSYMMLACLFAIFSTKLSVKILLIASTVPLSLAVNILRVTGTGILAHLFGERVAQGFFHEFSGIILFFVGLIILFLEFNLLNSKAAFKKPECGR
ncbi:MAG: exosortase/archaeosortase family protein [bacterium]|nr:MAG: exosortase/archaeosortase family protein [bacterium]